MTREEKIKAVETWLSVVGQHRHETQGFTLYLQLLTDDDLTTLRFVYDWVLDFAPEMFRVVIPAYHAEMRRTIAYLSRLQDLQRQAWARKLDDWETKTNELSGIVAGFEYMTTKQIVKLTTEWAQKQ
jgi:hypothetical protein